jgi:LysR family glycine cleavage system transcriptional activator/LysR family transcriptional regulator of beta-lactamase
MMPAIRPTHKFDSFVTALEAAKQGAGICSVHGRWPTRLCVMDTFVTLSDFALSSGTGHYLTAPSGAQLSRAEEDVRHWFALVLRHRMDDLNRIDTCCQQPSADRNSRPSR